MQLELKHLAGYLPYGLNGIINGKIVRMCTMHQNSIQTFPSIRKYTWCAYEDFKPILHPLSDLTKDIEVNEEKFVPRERIEDVFFWDYVILNMRDIVKNNDYSLVEYLPKNVVEKLLEWHFDIYGIIGNGLAIDINTLEK